MRKALLLFILTSAFGMAFSQAGLWTWMKGDSVINSVGTYGVQGVPNIANTPIGAYEGCEWTDTAGNFWFFGGASYISSVIKTFGDLWKYNPASNEWTWIKGSGLAVDLGDPGTMGIPAPTNRPAAKGWGTPTWVSLDGDLWLYGGMVTGSTMTIMNDLWRYNIATNTWTWMQGSMGNGVAPVLGVQGVPAPANTPGGTVECSATWVDSTGNLWMFGGATSSTAHNRLWKYDMALNQWAWMKGSTTSNAIGVYGVKGVPDPGNTPGARSAYSSWKDKEGNFWLFGGKAITAAYYNDMWKYDCITNNWTWMSGSSLVSDSGHYGQACVSATDSFPSSRMETRSRWTDDCGNFWLFGGGQGGSFQDVSWDMWCFSPTRVEWRLIEGDNTRNVVPRFGTKGVPAVNTKPGGRGGSVGWRSRTGELYLFGGTVRGWPKPYNDLWKYTIDTACLGNFNCSACAGGVAGIITALSDTVCKDQPPVLHFSGIIQNVQWQYSTDSVSYIDLVGLTGEDCLDIPTQTSYYRVKSSDGNCPLITDPIRIVVDTTCQITRMEEIGEERVRIYPNPSSVAGCQLSVASSLVGANLEVLDANGRVVFLTTINQQQTTISPVLSSGVYFIRISSPRASVVKKFIRL